MIKRLLMFVVAVSIAGPLLAAGNHPMSGCGLAYILFSNNDNRKGIQILASTTNGLYGTQTFGITSGTSGCTEDGAVAENRVAELYAEVNLREIMREMAIGEGEYLTAFASLVSPKAPSKEKLIQFMHENYEVLFPSENTTALDMLSILRSEIGKNPELLS